MGSLAFLCSGQGAQRAGMGAGFAGVPEADEVFEAAGDVCGFDVRAACSDAQALADAARVQPALCAVSIAAARSLAAAGVRPDFVAGFSLGQVAALNIAGMLPLEATFALCRVRAQALADAAAAHPGAMCALTGADEAAAFAVCEQAAHGAVLVPANFNAPGQIVISGERAAVERAAALWAAEGRRATMLQVAGAFHSPLMREAEQAVRAHLAHAAFREPRVPVVCNTDARPLRAADAAERMARQISSPVQFERSIAFLRGRGVDAYAECGSGAVLRGLVRRIDASAARYGAASPDDIARIAEDRGRTAPEDPSGKDRS